MRLGLGSDSNSNQNGTVTVGNTDTSSTSSLNTPMQITEMHCSYVMAPMGYFRVPKTVLAGMKSLGRTDFPDWVLQAAAESEEAAESEAGPPTTSNVQSDPSETEGGASVTVPPSTTSTVVKLGSDSDRLNTDTTTVTKIKSLNWGRNLSKRAISNKKIQVDEAWGTGIKL